MRDIKFKYYFNNHAPIQFTISEIEVGKPMNMCYRDGLKIKTRVQYTGSKDADRQEIYEGDIWELDKERDSRLTPNVNKYLIEWIDHIGAFGLSFYWQGEKDHYDMSLCKLGKVVGNKFEYEKYQQYCKDNSID